MSKPRLRRRNQGNTTMAYINQNAQLIGELQFQNGNKNQLWLGYNSNTGEPIVWQRVFSVKANKWTPFKRSTGRNIVAIKNEMDQLFNRNIATWSKEPKDIILQSFLAIAA